MKAAAAPAPRDRFFRSDGLKLHYVEWGDRAHETLVLVHGNRDQCRSWDFFVSELLAQGPLSSHVVALDLRGHGDSGWSPRGRGYQHEGFIRDLAGLLRHLKKDSAALIGHSLGGSMSLLFAGCFPARVRKLVLIEAVGPFARSDEDVPNLLARWVEEDGARAGKFFYPTLTEAARAVRKRFPLIPEAACDHMARYGTRGTDRGYLWKYDPRVRFPSYSTFSEGQVRAFIQRLNCPTLLIYGAEGDFMDSPRASRLGLFKKSQVVAIAGSGHHVPHERPDGLARAVFPFLRE
jgi:pimeloyl-ACP methyl ester carboxylesterase